MILKKKKQRKEETKRVLSMWQDLGKMNPDMLQTKMEPYTTASLLLSF